MRQVLATKFVKSAVKCSHNIALCAFLTTSQKQSKSPWRVARMPVPTWNASRQLRLGNKAAAAGNQLYCYTYKTHTHTDILYIYIHTLCTWVHRIYTEMCLRYSTNNSHIWSFWLLYEYLIQRPISRHSLPWNVRHVGANPEWRRAAFRGPTSSVFFAY